MTHFAITLSLLAFLGTPVIEARAEDAPEKKNSIKKTSAKESAKKAEAVKGKPDLRALVAKLKAAVASGEITKAEAAAKYKIAVLKGGSSYSSKTRMRKGRKKYGSFYSVVIGRLESKDIELGEFELDVDYVTSIYGDPRLKDTIIGKTVKVVGVSGPWLDKLLQIRKGETLKVRSGTLQGTTISLSPKATVLERAVPFNPDVYPIPPKEFRGFHGIIRGEIISKSDQGFELTLRVDKVEESFAASQASEPGSIEGHLIDMQGFYTNSQHRATFRDLRIGDTIRVGATHRDPAVDPLDVARVFEQVEK